MTFIRRAALLAFASMLTSPADAARPRSVADLSQMSIEEIANLEISSVSKHAEPLNTAPAAIFVITSDDIRRSGARSVPEALRLAPNLQVAQIDASNYAITARGFNHPTGTSNKLLVLIDGRTVYTTLYSGVFWDAQDILLEDVDRIEVIRGPGGTLWGANAVDGVINIITRSSARTQGVMATAGSGTEETSVALRFGDTLGENFSYRIYGKAFERAATKTTSGISTRDAWDKAQGGFRADWIDAVDTFTVQGDIYKGDADDIANTQHSGHNLVARWTRVASERTSFETQAYYDYTRRSVVTQILDKTRTYDVNAQLTTLLGESQQLVAGAGYRHTDDTFLGGPGTTFVTPAKRALNLANVFVQDTLRLGAQWKVVGGIKAEHNEYTGWELMPNVRLAWQPRPDLLVWASVARAVRTPSRFDRDIVNPGLLVADGTFESEDVVAYELGYRSEVTSSLMLSLTGYYNEYDNLRSVEPAGAPLFPLTIRNNMIGHAYGAELWARVTLAEWWRLSLGGNAMKKKLRFVPGSRDFFGIAFAGNDPDTQFSVNSHINLADNVEFDTSLRYVDALPSPLVPSYVEADLRLAWRPTETLELAFSGRNLLHDSHPEFGAAPARKEIRRTFYVSTRWDF